MHRRNSNHGGDVLQCKQQQQQHQKHNMSPYRVMFHFCCFLALQWSVWPQSGILSVHRIPVWMGLGML